MGFSKKQQAGFIQAVILFGIALIAAVIGAFALSGKGATKNTSSEEAKLAASTLLKQAGDLQEAIQRFRSDRGGFNGLTFSKDADTGLFNTNDRFATLLVGPPKGYVTRKPGNSTGSVGGNVYGSWSLKKALTIDGVANNWVVVTTGLTKTTCIRINNLLYGTQYPTTLDPMSSTVPASTWESLSTVITLNFTGSDTTNGIPTNATEGCVGTTSTATNPETGGVEATYVYFKTVNEGGAI